MTDLTAARDAVRSVPLAVAQMTPLDWLTPLLALATLVLALFAIFQWTEARRSARALVIQAHVTFNKELLVRLGDVQLAIARDPEARAAIWNPDPDAVIAHDGGVADALAQSMCDVMALALEAVEVEMPGFKVDLSARTAYIRWVFANSPALTHMVLGVGCEWWPELARMARQIHAADGTQGAL